MFERMSVRKPFTVLVMVILIIVLGIVSFTNTSTDLLPSMNLPYAVVITTYPGATPEQVETDVTAPIEARMGTIGGIKNVSSVSNEHFSLVILEFTDTTNMDSASLEIRESLDMLTFPEMAQKPSILRLNPDMMPIMVASIYAETMTISELSEFAKNSIAPAFEGIPGVASVSPSGLIQNQLFVILNEDKIGETNQRMRDAVQKMIEDAQGQMEALITAQVEAQIIEYSANRTVELIGQGYSPEQANMQLMAELPAVSEQIAEEAATAMMAAITENPQVSPISGTGDIESMGIPAEMLTIDMIKTLITAQNFSMPAGMFDEDGEEIVLRVGDKFRSADEIKSMLLFEAPIDGFEAVRLSDIADVIVTDNSSEVYARVNGNPAVMITMQKQTEFSTSDLTSEIRAKMEELSDKHADIGLEFAVMMDQGSYIDIIISSILNNLLIGGILALFILMLFLRDLRPTLVVGISIPISLMLAFTAMYFTGVSLNIISMSGLALSVGMLIDNSIVVIDNTYRLRNQGLSARRAAVQGAGEVMGAIVACTLTTIAVFLPIVFTQGLTRQIFTDLGLTIAYSLLASLLIALTVVPAASSAVFYKMKEKENKSFNKFRDAYAKLLKGSLKVKWAVLLVAVAAVIASGLAIYAKGTEFFPAMETDEITVTVTMPEDAAFEDAVAITEELSAYIQSIKDVKQVGASIGSGGMLGMVGSMFGMGGGGGGLGIDIYIILEDSRSMKNEVIANSILQKSEDMNCEVEVQYNAQSDEMSFLTGEAISVNITGRELDDLRDTALEVAEIVRSVEGAINIRDGSQRAAPELRVRVDKDKAMAKGLTVAQVFMAANKVITNPEAIFNMNLSGLDYEIIIQDKNWNEPGRKEIEALELLNNSGEFVKLTDVAEIYDDVGFTSIRRNDNARYITVSGEIEEGYNVGLVNDEIERRLQDYTPRDGCTVSIGGEAEAIAVAFKDLYLMLALALVFIYLIMVAQFQSLLSPFIVMFTIPLAFTGGFLGLLISGMTLSIVAMIGLILLAGVIVSNGIVFVDCVNRLRKGGLKKKDALIEAGRIRLRPILMTALTTIAAMSTMTIGMGMGTSMVQPMAVTVVGGLTYATLMTLFVVPCMYDLLHRDRDMTRDEDLDYDILMESVEKIK